MQVEWAVLCDAANSLPDGRINILGQFKQLNSFVFPIQVPTMSLVARITASFGEKNTPHRVRVAVIDQDGIVLAPPAQMEIVIPDLPGPDVSLAAVIGMNGLVYKKPGEYRVDLTIDNSSVINIPFKFNLMTPPPGMQFPQQQMPPNGAD